MPRSHVSFMLCVRQHCLAALRHDKQHEGFDVFVAEVLLSEEGGKNANIDEHIGYLPNIFLDDTHMLTRSGVHQSTGRGRNALGQELKVARLRR